MTSSACTYAEPARWSWKKLSLLRPTRDGKSSAIFRNCQHGEGRWQVHGVIAHAHGCGLDLSQRIHLSELNQSGLVVIVNIEKVLSLGVAEVHAQLPQSGAQLCSANEARAVD